MTRAVGSRRSLSPGIIRPREPHPQGIQLAALPLRDRRCPGFVVNIIRRPIDDGMQSCVEHPEIQDVLRHVRGKAAAPAPLIMHERVDAPTAIALVAPVDSDQVGDAWKLLRQRGRAIVGRQRIQPASSGWQQVARWLRLAPSGPDGLAFSNCSPGRPCIRSDVPATSQICIRRNRGLGSIYRRHSVGFLAPSALP